MKFLWCCPDYSGWILAGWHHCSGLFYGRRLVQKELFWVCDLLTLHQATLTLCVKGKWKAVKFRVRKRLWALLPGYVSNPKEPPKQNKTKNENKSKRKQNTTQFRPWAWDRFSSWTPEKGAHREVCEHTEKFCLVFWGHMKLQQPQCAAFPNATRPMVPDRAQQRSPGEQLGRHLTQCLALLASANKTEIRRVKHCRSNLAVNWKQRSSAATRAEQSLLWPHHELEGMGDLQQVQSGRTQCRIQVYSLCGSENGGIVFWIQYPGAFTCFLTITCVRRRGEKKKKGKKERILLWHSRNGQGQFRLKIMIGTGCGEAKPTK